MTTDNGPSPEKTDILPGLASQQNRGRRFLALSLMAVAAVFSGVVIAALVMTHLEDSGTGRPESAVLKELLVLKDRHPQNEGLREAYRREDLRVREAHAARRRRMAVGPWLLLVGVTVLVLSGRWYASLDRRLPRVLKASLAPGNVEQVRLRRRATIAVAGVAMLLAAVVAALSIDWTSEPAETSVFKDNWPGFRGPTAMGIVPAGEWPEKWDDKSGTNILWKTEVPLPGQSSPVVWGKRIFLSGADKKSQKVFCFDRTDGRMLWEAKIQSPETMTRLAKGPDGEIIVDQNTGYAAPTPVTDGKRLYAVFAGGDLAAVDFSGKVLWVQHMGVPDSVYGLSSSLALYKDTIIFQFDQGSSAEYELSALLGLDAATGTIVWRTGRPVGATWSSPILVNVGEETLILTTGDPWVIAYEAASGIELWRASGLAGDVGPSAIYADGKVFVTNESAEVMAIRTGGEGDVTKTHVVWTSDEATSDASSPVCDGKLFLQANGPGGVSCFDAVAGKLLWEKSFGCGFWASPTLVGEVVYLPGDDGKTILLKFAPTYHPLTENNLGEPLYATPAFCDGKIYFRGEKHLFCIGVKDAP